MMSGSDSFSLPTEKYLDKTMVPREGLHSHNPCDKGDRGIPGRGEGLLLWLTSMGGEKQSDLFLCHLGRQPILALSLPDSFSIQIPRPDGLMGIRLGAFV